MDGGAGREAEAAAQVRWRAAEDRLYPMAMSDPDGYRRALEAVQVLVDELRRTASTFDELLAVEADPTPLLAALPAGPALSSDLLVQAACGARGRELGAAREGARRAAAVAAARAEGRAWVVLEGPERIEELVGGRTVATHLSTGRTLMAVLDPYSGADPFLLQEFDADGEPGRDRMLADRGEWVTEWDRWRTEIESS